MSNPVLSLLGLALRGGRLAVGEEPVALAARAGQTRLLLLAADAAGNTLRRAEHLAQEGHCLSLVTPFSKAELGGALGRGSAAIVALTDTGLAAAVTERLALQDPERYGEAAARMDLKRRRAMERQSAPRRDPPPEKRRPPSPRRDAAGPKPGPRERQEGRPFRPNGSPGQGQRPRSGERGRPYGGKPEGRPHGGKTEERRPYNGKPQERRPYGSKTEDRRPHGGRPEHRRPQEDARERPRSGGPGRPPASRWERLGKSGKPGGAFRRDGKRPESGKGHPPKSRGGPGDSSGGRRRGGGR